MICFKVSSFGTYDLLQGRMFLLSSSLLYFLFTKICVSKNPSLQLQVLSTFWQLYNGIFSSIAIGRQMSPQTHQIFSSYLIFFSCISSSFSASLHSRPSVVLRVAAQNEVDSWIRGAASCSEGEIY